MTIQERSAREKRESGSPRVAGSSQASAVTSATCSGRKTTRTARALAILVTGQTLLEEAFPPTADDVARGLQPACDLGIARVVGGVQDHRRHDHVVRQRVPGDGSLELGPLLAAQLDHDRTSGRLY